MSEAKRRLPKEGDYHRMTIQVSPDTMKQIKKISAAEGLSESAIASRMLDIASKSDDLANQVVKPERRSRRARRPL